MNIVSLDQAIRGHTPTEHDIKELYEFLFGCIKQQGNISVLASAITEPKSTTDLLTNGITMVVLYAHQQETYWKDLRVLLQNMAKKEFCIDLLVRDIACKVESPNISLCPVNQHMDAYEMLCIEEAIKTGKAIVGDMYLRNFKQQGPFLQDRLFSSFRRALARYEGLVQQITLQRRDERAHTHSLHRYTEQEIERVVEVFFEILNRHFMIVDKRISSLQKNHLAERSFEYQWSPPELSTNISTFSELVYGYYDTLTVVLEHNGEHLPKIMIDRYTEVLLRLQGIPPLALSVIQGLVTQREENT